MMGNDIGTSLAEELSSSYIWQSAASSEYSLSTKLIFFGRVGIREPPRLSYHHLPSY